MVSWQRRSTRVAAILAVACVLLPGCKGRRPSRPVGPEDRPILGSITVKPIPATEFRGKELRLDEPRVAAKVRSVLTQAGIFDEARPNRAAVAVILEVQPFTEGNVETLDIGVRVRLKMSVHPENAALARFREDVAAIGQAPLAVREVDEARAAFQRLAERTTEDLLMAYTGRQILWAGDDRDVGAALSSAEKELRVEALHIVAERKLREQVPAILRMLTDEDEDIRDAALGALIALRERSAIKVLAESRPMRDAREMHKILDAIATLGGSEAEDYLGFVAETHDDEEIRAMAKAALARLTRQAVSVQPTR
jgi:hypothetical protein